MFKITSQGRGSSPIYLKILLVKYWTALYFVRRIKEGGRGFHHTDL